MTRMARGWIGAAALALVLAAPRGAAADGFTIGARPVWFVTGGATAGGSVVADDRGGFVGGELSLARLRENRFVGLYADGCYDFGFGGTYVTAGPELGLIRRSLKLPLSLGIDGGGAVRIGDATDVGATGRVFLGLFGTVALYGRYVYVHTDAGADHVVQVGVTLKFPLGPPWGAGTRRTR
jgi:hypothetical protein